jgi:hypothetical protein
LQEGRYQQAYAMLSSDSQQRHAAADFEQLGKKGMPLYDLSTAKAISDGDKPVVAVQLTEEPGSHGFTLVRESDTWKIVYRGGIPGSPDP